MSKLWERQWWDTDKSYHYFHTYYLLQEPDERTLNEAYNSTIENIFRLKDIIREKTGIRSLFNGRLKKRERAVLENQILSQQRLASEKFDEMRKVTSMQTDLAIEISSLKTNEFQIRKD